MLTTKSLGIGLSMLLVSSMAWGQDGFNVPTEGGTDGNVEYRKVTEYDFEADVVEGSFVRPEGEFFSGNGNQAYGSLIRIREDFVPEMLKSAEDI
jgi:hypothetical protein